MPPTKKRKFVNSSSKAEGTSSNENPYQQYFKFKKPPNSLKIGICQECEPREGPSRGEIKMKDSNTSGLKRHLEIYHEKIYESLFGKPVLESTQKTLKSFVTVNIFFNFNFFGFYRKKFFRLRRKKMIGAGE